MFTKRRIVQLWQFCVLETNRKDIFYDLEDLKAISNIGDFQIGKLKIFVSGPNKNYNYNKKERLQRLREYRVIIALFADL